MFSMIMMILIFLLFGSIKHISSIECYTCKPTSYYCSSPLNFDGGDESNENDIEISNYPTHYACLSDQSFNPRTGKGKVILRGIEHCKELNIPNHRIHCCYTNYCNKDQPTMTSQSFADLIPIEKQIESNTQCCISSMILVALFTIFNIFYYTVI